MTRTTRSLVVTVATAGLLFAIAVTALAETCTLKLKRRESQAYDQASYMYWWVMPQYIYSQMTADANGRWQPANAGNDSPAEAFKRIVTKEPKYHSANPFRGVVKFGGQEYAFALDAVPDAKAKKPDTKQATAKAGTVVFDVVAADESEAKPAATQPPPKLVEKPPAKPAPLKDFAYNRLYFDFNHNGDLTDDKVIESPLDANRYPVFTSGPGMSYARFDFPRIDLTLDVDGTKLDYSFHLDGYANSSANFCNVGVSVTSAVCREGDITLEGKRHHIVLLDFNSNGRFDDQTKISSNIHLANGQLYPEQGDMLLIDPKAGSAAFDSPYDPAGSDYRYYVGGMISIDGRWYDLKITPGGDKLTLTPSAVPLGNVKNRNESFRALIYSEGKGFIKIRGSKDAPIPIPEGQWKLLSYTITCAEPAKPAAKPAAEAGAGKTAETKPAEKHGSLLAGLSQLFGGGASELARGGPSVVSATATEKYQAVTVRHGETVELPFGPPYTPTVTAMSYGPPNVQAQQLSLEMSLVGVAGEACTNMVVKGARPGKPEFTITDPKGKVVQQGSFEYG